MLGRFLEISVHAPDILESLAFYESLGFTQAAAGDAWSHPYAVVTDGRLFIGLHAYEFDSPSLTFVQPDLMANLERIETLGIELAFRKVGADVFNEAGFTDPNRQMIALLEARTYSPPQRRPHETSKLGWFEEFALPTRDLAGSARWWERLGFVAAEQDEEPWPRVGLTSDSLDVALVAAGNLRGPALVFKEPDMPERIRALTDRGYECTRHLPRGLDPREAALLVAPEGTSLLLLTG